MARSALPHVTQVTDQVAVAGDGPVLWLVRHGESTWNTLGLAQGHCDRARLTRAGLRQAWAVADRLRGRPAGALFASDLRRALETAAPLAEVLGLAVTRDARLRERCLGVLEGAATAAIGPAANGLAGDRVVDPDARPDGGESLRDFYRRVAGFADELAAGLSPRAGRATGAERAGEIVVVAHGGTLRVLTAYLRGIPVEQMRWEPLGNGCIVRAPAGWPPGWQAPITNPDEKE
jgi:2,3-bisphosphoglycerate-dependent phosphoglycerate mutase